ncbi:MAG: hypothetical protein JWM80_2610 [Cyanobacteria bacterium RYN_339]|nr:hypothetical protein [Cyanobacteria bacterium RYN_339]
MRPIHLFATLALMLAPGCTAIGAYMPDPGMATSADRNQQVQYHLNTLRMALEQYATDFNGSYPEPAKLREQILRDNYLPGNRFPQDPWGAAGQEMAVVTLEVPDWKDADEFPKALPSLAFVSKGLPAAARRPGTIVYMHNTYSQTYSVYGIGEKLGLPEVVAGVTNGNSYVLLK